MALDFVYLQPVQIFFGPGKLSSLGELLEQLQVERALLVCDAFFAGKARQIQAACPAVKAVFSDVEPNPQLSGAAAAVQLARSYQVQAVIGLGGGSAMDTAKFAAATALGQLDPHAYYDGEPFPQQRLKIFAIPTTSGTGSEVTQVSVMNDGPVKRTINNPAFMPTAALVDPELMLSVPPRTTMITGLDALSHALEGYWSKNHQPLTDLYAVEAVRVILGSLERAYQDGQDREARTQMAYGALLAGMAFAQPKTAGCHACSYPLSMDYHLPHGEACAFTLDSFVEINDSPRLQGLARAAGLESSEELAGKIRRLKEMAGLRLRLDQLGSVDLDKLAQDCAAHPLMGNNPVPMDARALTTMFEKLG